MTKMVRVGVFVAMAICFAVGVAMAAEGAATGANANGDTAKAGIAIAAGLGLGVAALGGAIGQGKAVASALDSIGRNPGASGKVMTPMIIGLAMIESLVIYALVISLVLVFTKL
jgi:F-type H+-transporting ATPase subunit c